jgi:uncharacterized protein
MQKGLKTAIALALLLSLSGWSSWLPWGDEEKKEESTEATVEEQSKPLRLNIALGQAGGANSAAGNAICVALKKNHSKLPCKLIESKGSEENLAAIASEQVDLALVRADSAYLSWHGKPPFRQRNAKLRVLFSLHHEVVTLLANGEAQIPSFSHIADKAIHVGPLNTANGRLISSLLTQCQIPIANTFNQDKSPLVPLLEEEKVQGGFALLSHPVKEILTLTKSRPLMLLPITGQCVERLVDEIPSLDAVKIPGGLYPGLPSSIPTVGAKIWLVASSDLSDEAVYEVIKAVFDEVKQFRRMDLAFYHLSARKMLSSFVIPYHGGAIQYLQEKGWYQEHR